MGLVNQKKLMRLFVFMAALLLAAGCKKNCTEDIPSCIQTEIEQFQNRDAICLHGASVTEYIFQGKRVFVFYLGDCIADGSSMVKDESCTELGSVGGISGTMLNGVEFYSNAQLVRKIWGN
jgi:hypothetical protein